MKGINIMGRPQKEIGTKRVKSIARGVSAITLHGKVETGPVEIIGREMSFFISEADIASVLSTLAGMSAYRNVFRAVADELDHREAIAESPGSAPVISIDHALNTLESGMWIRDTIMDTVSETWLNLAGRATE